jgi:hypothetical protein
MQAKTNKDFVEFYTKTKREKNCNGSTLEAYVHN